MRRSQIWCPGFARLSLLVVLAVLGVLPPLIRHARTVRRRALEAEARRNLRRIAPLFLFYNCEHDMNALPDADRSREDLRGYPLSGGYLWRVKFARADLRGGVLSRTSCCAVDFRGARMDRADLREAKLWKCDLRDADLTGADLRGVVCDAATHWPAGYDPRAHGALLAGPGADLRKRNLGYADLRGADLRGASLWNAHLGGADLSTARLEGANVDGAVYTYFTRWPDRFDEQEHGAQFSHDEGK